MSIITEVLEKNTWNEICKEFSAKRFPSTAKESDKKEKYINYDPARHHPAFYGVTHTHVLPDSDPSDDFNPSMSHPACVGYAFLEKTVDIPPLPTPLIPEKDSCSTREFLEYYIFPVLLPALEELLKQAKLEKCFERKRTKFSALDFLTEYLYNHNQKERNRKQLKLLEIPFVREWLIFYPRPPLPKSLIWTEEEAAVAIQSFWRGYLVRRTPEVQELHKWQREWREKNMGIDARVNNLWNKKMPNWKLLTHSGSDLVPIVTVQSVSKEHLSS